jgi:hypothetical protein
LSERLAIHQDISDQILAAVRRHMLESRLLKPSPCSARAAGRLTPQRQPLEPRDRMGPLGLSQPRQKIAAIPDQ